jgi:NTP pyrophosphatase (non-canonical NTP hydrolase)
MDQLHPFGEKLFLSAQPRFIKSLDEPEKFLLFTEEVGELAKAIRKTQGLYQEKARQKHVELAEEFADVLSYLLDLANCFQVDLETAFREKEQVNATRTWE